MACGMKKGSAWVGLVALSLGGCGIGDEATGTTGALTSPPGAPSVSVTGAAQQALIPANFLTAGLSGSIETVECTLSGGTATTCYRITTKGAPADHEVGDFCPATITSGGAGLWIENGRTYDLSGEFIRNLAAFYSDPNWQLFDPATGKVRITDTQEAFEGAARPDVAAAYQNHCVEGKMSYVSGGVSRTYLIPTRPVPLASGPGRIGRGGVGVAVNGIPLDPPAPVDRIKAAYTIAAFDDCGGHINPHEGYHYHAATGCSTTVASGDGHAPLIAYALDGYGIHAMTDAAGTEAMGLDACRGHTDEARGYHYHVVGAGENMFIGCFRGEQGSVS